MWPKPIFGSSFEKGLLLGVFLKSLSSREELALFLVERGHCLLENLQVDEALKAYWAACELDDNDPFHRCSWQMATLIHRALDESKTGETRAFPPDGIQLPPPRKDWELSVHRATRQSLDRIVSNLRKRSVVELPV